MKYTLLFIVFFLSGCMSPKFGYGSPSDVKKSLPVISYTTNYSPTDFLYCLAPRLEEIGHAASYRVAPSKDNGELILRAGTVISAIVSIKNKDVEVRTASGIWPGFSERVNDHTKSCL